MLQWLKDILGEAYTGEIDKKVSEEIGKGFVARADFNTLNDAKKQLEKDVAARDGQIAELKKTDPADLQATITRLQKENADNKKALEAQLKQTRVDAAVEAALVSTKAKNTKAVRALLELKEAEIGEDGAVKGLAEQLKQLSKADDTAFLFGADSKPAGQFKGLKGGESYRTPDGGIDASKMSYEQLADFMAANPDAKI